MKALISSSFANLGEENQSHKYDQAKIFNDVIMMKAVLLVRKDKSS